MKRHNCSQCNLVNFSDAEICKRCGTSLTNPSLGPAHRTSRVRQGSGVNRGTSAILHLENAGSAQNSDAHLKKMIIGGLFVVGGLTLTMISYRSTAAGGGGRYMIFVGAIIFGTIDFLRGLHGLLTNQD